MADTPSLPPKPPTELRPEEEDRLTQLSAEYTSVETQLLPLLERYDALKGAIKAEMAKQLNEGERAILLHSPYLAKPLRFRAEDQWRLDMPKFKAAHPHLYVEFANKSTVWKLEKVKDS